LEDPGAGLEIVGFWLPLLFVGLPIAEIAVFILVGGAIGVLPTLALVVLAAVAGVAVVRWQGLQTLVRLQASLESGGDPTGPLAHGALVAIAGVLLVIPGFITDVVGLLLLVPAVRSALIRRGAARTTVRVSTFARTRRPHTETIETDYEVVDDGPRPRGPNGSGWTRPHS
jgi:UPF0716 protein FxsA